VSTDQLLEVLVESIAAVVIEMRDVLQLHCARACQQEVLLGALELVESFEEDVDGFGVWAALDDVVDVVGAGIVLENSVELLDDDIEVLLLTFEGFGDIVEGKDVLFDLLG
jgi:hypothetical protein